MNITILRIGHRQWRDARVTTHVGLTARALGADSMLLAGSDKHVKESIEKVTECWGGNFTVHNNIDWKKRVVQWKKDGGKIIHLTMYGVSIQEALPQIHTDDKLLIIVGAEKVPSELYQIADLNVAVGNQPHSEIAALAIFLDRLNIKQGIDSFTRNYPGGKCKIIPQAHGKKVIKDEIKYA
ncbi:MAG: tRNA (cytidine(56)-2'-O)-methyltransferase [Candidatus Argoarchaeum ethanivorans]|uniref:tRNA (cytidine(56)-2'-O)-methyltransferase n=1 Tax=Candidatus Argoarchaeum ethanivorans TaxID=2608793 RepID=A0A811T5V1_9EURY|nr:MAG: tRNA (cytidine(56)-2'-O)-methyltransferase [Candidatus Argoarchaeum ethanivorans]CAD6492417.1 MAG: tRNA (cytidine(56)-2'-O)-methyltransferase [Candidatus Argoarchaeum ethanivorans]